MRLRTRVVAVAGTLALAAGLVAAFSGSASAAAPPPIDVSRDHVVCNTVTGRFNFVPAYNLTAQSIATGLLSKVGGCTDTDNSSVKLDPSSISVKGTVHQENANCGTLLGISTVTTTAPIVFKWKVVQGQAKLMQPVSSLQLSELITGVFSPGGTWGGAQYTDFRVVSGATVTGAFTGGDGGAGSSLEVITGQDLAATAFACRNGGLKSVTLGIGHINLG